MNRLTDNDRRFGPITYAKSGWRPTRLVWSSGGADDEEGVRNMLTAYAFGWVVRVPMPNVIKPYRVRHKATSWDEATIARMGRDWWEEVFPREYGFSVNEGFLQVFLGPQTHDSKTTRSWSKFLPWTQWRHIRFSLYDLEGRHVWSQRDRRSIKAFEAFEAQRRAEENCPKAVFDFDDYDGKRIQATTHIEEREWRFGEGWFAWLSLFRRPKIRRSLDICFSSEVGPEKGSWKGGTIGHSIDMLPGELHEQAFRRYCEQEHHSKYRQFSIAYVGRV